MTNIIKKFDYYFEACLEAVTTVTIMVLIPLLLATPLVLLIWGVST